MQLKAYPNDVLGNQNKTHKAHVRVEYRKTFRNIRGLGSSKVWIKSREAVDQGKGGHEGRRDREPQSKVQDSGGGVSARLTEKATG